MGSPSQILCTCGIRAKPIGLYEYVTLYLKAVKPALAAISAGELQRYVQFTYYYNYNVITFYLYMRL